MQVFLCTYWFTVYVLLNKLYRVCCFLLKYILYYERFCVCVFKMQPFVRCVLCFYTSMSTFTCINVVPCLNLLNHNRSINELLLWIYPYWLVIMQSRSRYAPLIPRLTSKIPFIDYYTHWTFYKHITVTFLYGCQMHIVFLNKTNPCWYFNVGERTKFCRGIIMLIVLEYS